MGLTGNFRMAAFMLELTDAANSAAESALAREVLRPAVTVQARAVRPAISFEYLTSLPKPPMSV